MNRVEPQETIKKLFRVHSLYSKSLTTTLLTEGNGTHDSNMSEM